MIAQATQQQRLDRLRLLIDVSQRITSILDIDELLGQVVTLIHRAFGYYHVGIGLIEGDEIVYRVGAGPLWDSPDFRVKPVRLKVGKEGLAGWVAQTGQPLVIPNVHEEPRYVRINGNETQSELTVPIKIKGAIIGVLDVQSVQRHDFKDDDVDLLMALANQTGIAIENARLYENAGRLAALEERQRLARDLHDSVTQSLYGILLYSQAAALQLATRHYRATAKHIDEINETAQETLAEMRLLIFELRPPILEKEGLLAALQARLAAVEGRAGLKTHLKTNLTRRLGNAAEEGLYRIAQEALNNTLKHAYAHTVKVTLTETDTHIILEIVDDGVGFDPDNAFKISQMGLAGMQSHAAELGGTLSIVSAPGTGSKIKVVIKQC